MVRPRYTLPGDLAPGSLGDRRRFYQRGMDYSSAREWMSSPPGERVYALILGRHSGIYPRRFRHLKNVPLVIDDVLDVRDLRPYLVKYLPEGVYYDRNVYASLAAARKARVDYAHAWRSRLILGQQLGQGRQAFIGRARGGRQTEVQNDNRRPMVVECAGRAWPILGQQHLIITRQRPFHLGANLLVIIDNQQFRLHAPEVCSGNNTRKVVPFPFSLSTSILPRWALTIILR